MLASILEVVTLRFIELVKRDRGRKKISDLKWPNFLIEGLIFK